MLEVIIYAVFGLIIFFFGLSLVEKSLKKGVGIGLKNILHSLTSNTLSGIMTGMIVTAVLQSSSAVSVMTISFINGGILTLSQGMGVIIGSNIGTTVTIHILSFKIKYLEWTLCALGLGLFFFGKRKSIKYYGLSSIGFGLVFLGMSVLQIGFSPLQYLPTVIMWLTEFGKKPLLAILSGLCLTALIQSSSATSGLILTLASQGMIVLKGAIGIILGSNIGTCVTALIAGLRVNEISRRLAYFHIIFNCFGVLLFIPMLDAFTLLVSQLTANPGRQIAIAHTLFNFITALAILPFIKHLEKILSV